jgi:hypothetical protein
MASASFFFFSFSASAILLLRRGFFSFSVSAAARLLIRLQLGIVARRCRLVMIIIDFEVGSGSTKRYVA